MSFVAEAYATPDLMRGADLADLTSLETWGKLSPACKALMRRLFGVINAAHAASMAPTGQGIPRDLASSVHGAQGSSGMQMAPLQSVAVNAMMEVLGNSASAEAMAAVYAQAGKSVDIHKKLTDAHLAGLPFHLQAGTPA